MAQVTADTIDKEGQQHGQDQNQAAGRGVDERQHRGHHHAQPGYQRAQHHVWLAAPAENRKAIGAIAQPHPHGGDEQRRGEKQADHAGSKAQVGDHDAIERAAHQGPGQSVAEGKGR